MRLPGYVDDGNEYQIPTAEPAGPTLAENVSGFMGAVRASAELFSTELVDRFALGGQDVPDLPRISPADIVERQKADGLTFAIPSQGMTAFELEYTAEKARTVKDAEERAANASPAVQVAGTLVGGIADPTLLMDVPGLDKKVGKLLMMSSKIASKTGRVATRTAIRAGQGAIEGVAGTALMTPITAAGHERLGREYGLEEFATDIGMSVFGGATLRGGVVNPIQEMHWRRQGKNVYAEIAKQSRLETPGAMPETETPRTGAQAVQDARAADAPQVDRPDVRDVHTDTPEDWRAAWVDGLAPEERARFVGPDGRITETGIASVRDAAAVRVIGEANLSRLVDLGDDASDALIEGAAMASHRIEDAPVASRTVEAIADVLARSREEGVPVTQMADVDPQLRSMASEVQRLGDSPQSIASVLGKFGDLARGLETADDANDAFFQAIATAWEGATAGAKLERMGPQGSDSVVQQTIEGMISGRAISTQAQVDHAVGVGNASSARAEVTNNASPDNRPFAAQDAQVEREANAYMETAAKEPTTPDEARRLAEDEVSKADKDLADLEEEIKRMQEANAKASVSDGSLPTDATPTRETVTESIRASLGDDGAKWIEDGRADVMTIEELRKVAPNAPADAVGVDLAMPDGSRKIVLVADRLAGMNPGRVLLHEIFHFQRDSILGAEGWADLRAQIQKALRSALDAEARGETLTGDLKAWREARSMVPSDTGEGLSASKRADLMDEETVAYLIEHAPESGFVRGLVAKVKAWLYANGFRVEMGEADLRALAVSMMRRPVEARGRAGVRFSTRKVTPSTMRENLRDAVSKLDRAEKLWPSALENLGEFDIKSFDADDEMAAGIERMAIDRMMKHDQTITAEDATALLSAWLSTGGNIEAAAEKLIIAQSEIVRRQAINARRVSSNFKNLIGAWKPTEFGEGLISLDDASMFLRSHSRRGVAQMQKGYEATYKRYIDKQLGDIREYAAGQLPSGKKMTPEEIRARDLDVFTALRDNVEPGAQTTLSDASVRMADAIRKTFNLMRKRGHDLGEILGELEDWGLTQAHDKNKLQNAHATIGGSSKAGTVVRAAIARKRGKFAKLGSKENFEAWASFVAPKMDLERMGIRIDSSKPVSQWTKKARAALESIYEGAAGLKRKAEDFGVTERKEVPGEIDDPRGVLQAFEDMHARRVIHFKDAESAFAYNEMFGPRDLMGGVTAIIEKNARSHGMRYIYGASPETARGRLIQMLRDHTGMEGRATSFSKAASSKMARVHDEVSGRLNDPVNMVASRVLANARSFSGASKLAATAVTQLLDAIPASISNSFRFGGNVFGGSLNTLVRLVARFDSAEKKAAIENLMVGFDHEVGEILRDQRGDVGGWNARIYDWTMKVGGVHYLDRTNMRTIAARIAHGFGEAASKPNAMPQTERLLSSYGFEGADDLRVLREASTTIDGRPFLSPENVPNVSKESLEKYAEKRGLMPDEAADDLELMLQTLISSEISMARMAPTARTRAFMKFGTRPGTFMGELARAGGQFKSYPAEYIRRMWVEWPDALGGTNILNTPMSGKLRIAGYIATMIAGGLMVQQLKALTTGKAWLPILEGDEDDKAFKGFDIPLVNDQTLIRAIMQAGVIPIYMDQILGPDATEPSKAIAEGMLGPTIGSAFGTAMSMLNAIKSFDPDAENFDKATATVNADLVRAAKGWTPFVGHWATKSAMDRLVWWQLQEMASPGWADKFETRSEAKGGMPYIGMRPTFEVAGKSFSPEIPEWIGKTFTATPTEAVQ